MATETTNLKLTKPALDDYVLVSDINENSDKIDNAHAEVSSAITTLATSVNDTNTALDNHKADYVAHPGYADATGTNTYSVSLKPAAKALVKGLGVVFTVANNATGNCTLNVNGLGAKAIMSSDGEQITDLKKGVVYTVRYNGTSFTLQGKGGGLDTLKIMQWLATTEPFKSSGYYLYLSKEKRILVRGGNGFPNAMRIYDLSGNMIQQLMLISDAKFTVSNKHIIMFRPSPALLRVYDLNGVEIHNAYNSNNLGAVDLLLLNMNDNIVLLMEKELRTSVTYIRVRIRKYDLNLNSLEGAYNMDVSLPNRINNEAIPGDTFLTVEGKTYVHIRSGRALPNNIPDPTYIFQSNYNSGVLTKIDYPTIL